MAVFSNIDGTPVRLKRGTGRRVHDGSVPQPGDTIYPEEDGSRPLQQQGNTAVPVGRNMPSEVYGCRNRIR